MKHIKPQLMIVALFLFGATSVFSSAIYDVSIDTSSLSGAAGYLYFTYIPANYAADTVATVTGFSGGSLEAHSSIKVVDGRGVSGELPSSVTFANMYAVNDYNHGITFGNNINFLLSFTDPVSGGLPAGNSTFSLGLFEDELGLTPLMTSDGSLFTAIMMNDGSVSTNTFLNQASIYQAPETGTIFLVGTGLLTLLGLKKRICG
jgi:hypothetical protein